LKAEGGGRWRASEDQARMAPSQGSQTEAGNQHPGFEPATRRIASTKFENNRTPPNGNSRRVHISASTFWSITGAGRGRRARLENWLALRLTQWSGN